LLTLMIVMFAPKIALQTN